MTDNPRYRLRRCLLALRLLLAGMFADPHDLDQHTTDARWDRLRH